MPVRRSRRSELFDEPVEFAGEDRAADGVEFGVDGDHVVDGRGAVGVGVGGVLGGGFVVASECGVGAVLPVADEPDRFGEPESAGLVEEELLVAREQLTPRRGVGAGEQVDEIERELAGGTGGDRGGHRGQRRRPAQHP